MRRMLIASFLGIVAIFFLFYARRIPPSEPMVMAQYYINNAFHATGAANSVTSVYLFYRYYDTLFETMTLFFSVVGVVCMSVHRGAEDNE